jgi:hypothetical protein
MDQALSRVSRVHVKCTNLAALPALNLTQGVIPAESEGSQIYEVLYVKVLVDEYEKASSHDNSVDSFLMQNPCWTVIVSFAFLHFFSMH